MTLSTIKVAVVDDQPLLVSAFSALVGAQPDMEVVLEAVNGREAVDRLSARAGTPQGSTDLVLMDLRMPVLDGISAIRELRAAPATASLRVLVLTTFDLDEYAFEAIRAGASGFLLKDTRPAELAEAIRTVAGGEAVVSPRITRRMLEMFASHLPEGGAGQAQEDPRIASLTPREREILILMAQGMSNAEIAADLVVSSTTVKTHVGNVLTKLNVRDRVQAVVVAYETGLMA